MQLILNIFVSFSLLLIVSFSFHLLYQVVKFFHIAHAVTITFGAYFTYLFSVQFSWHLGAAILLAIFCAVIISGFMELLIYKPLRRQGTSSWKMLIASLGIYVVLQNIISLFWGDGTKSIRTWAVKTGHNIFGAYITDVQIITITASIMMFVGVILFLRFTSLGQQIRAVSSNEELSNIFGISSGRVILWSFVIGSALGAIAGILIALDTDMTPTMGFHVLLYAVVAMIIGGVGSYKGLIGGVLLLATAQHLSAYYIDSKWMDATAYIILILFLIWKPLGFSGKLLKKVEI
ncbi:MAG: branched-chain amino acid ABC transporter permease [Candidatus Scalindua rubra]|uniref:High-affinity branched-chain amino acid transport system permease protein LivH n=1 Tax=Candidatus Scalindua brodae TaxID=237368 RepID=A0A0B0ECM6_9BACT|nr:MAG: High-affinity branched-chain amino acid transport system permease protein LivH [Candidatus Scalindua brodae]MBZ0109119.1 branched-chain amino acid ABC transporter permease [Candidatus Scalindua rubra]TWU33555.1 High-affinity branched-chain amino acid transport system permease protein LivH [Candidatus Brocadiaceae bacterium S225]